jgi:biopolymer transport protein ExbD
MRCPSVYHHRNAAIDLPMTPMIDVVFQLLIFFVWTAGFQVTEYLLTGSLSSATGTLPGAPRTPPPPERDFDDLVIRLFWKQGQPAWRLNDTPLASLAEVRARLRAVAAINPAAPVILHPDRDVPLGHVIDVYDVARRVGFRKVQFATSEARG